jgi:uncharacterized protein
MDCPVCKNVQLMMADRQGIEIDYCPNCRGVWLDRGELDKIIDRSAGNASSAQLPPQQVHGQHYQSGYGHSQPHGHHQRPYKKKREGFLGELFDFD